MGAGSFWDIGFVDCLSRRCNLEWRCSLLLLDMPIYRLMMLNGCVVKVEA